MRSTCFWCERFSCTILARCQLLGLRRGSAAGLPLPTFAPTSPRGLGGEGVGSSVTAAGDRQGRNPNAQDHSGSSSLLTVSWVTSPLKTKSSVALLDLMILISLLVTFK